MCAFSSLGAGAAAGSRCCSTNGRAISRVCALVPLQGAAVVCAWELGRWCRSCARRRCCVRLGAWVLVAVEGLLSVMLATNICCYLGSMLAYF